MNAFKTLQKYYSVKIIEKYSTGGMTNNKTIFNARTPSNITIEDTEIKREAKSLEKNEEVEEAVETAIDHGFDPDSSEGQKKIREILEGIAKKDSDTQRTQSMQKARPRVHEGGGMPASMYSRGNYPSSQPEIYAVARARRKKKNPSLRGDVHEEMGSDWDVGAGDKPHGSPEDILFREEAEARKKELAGERRTAAKEKAIMNMEKSSVSPHLARLLAAAAGWALSGDIAGKVDPHLAQEWDRASSHRDKKELQEEMMRQMHRMHKKPQAKLLVIHRKSDDGPSLENAPAFDDLHMFYKKEEDNIFFMKDHAPIPPRYGLLWDAVKHRWTRPEKVGRTVWEVQGHKRYRGTGTGAHERGRRPGGSGGYGVGSSEAGRRFRSVGDVGRAHPHESARVGQKGLKPFKKITQPKRR